MTAPAFLGWALESFVATTLLMALVLVIRAPVRRVFGPNIAYALWLLPVLRMALPPLPESWREQAAAPIAAASQAITVYIVDPIGAAPTASAQGGFDWLPVVLLLWGAGAALFLAFHLVRHGRFCAQLLRRARVDRTVAEGRVRVIETDAAHGPLAFGVWRKYVAFPRDFAERYDADERDLALAHEIGHHVRGDLIANWVALVVLAIHWFNPVAWWAFRAFRADQEMACDALVLTGRHQAMRHAYGRAIVKSAHGGAVSAACHLHTINELKGRLRMLSKSTEFSAIRRGVGLAAVGAVSLAALGLTASGTQAAERIKDKVAATIGADWSPQDAPPAPQTPPAPPAPSAVPPAPPAPPASGAHHVERHVYRIVTTDGDGKDAKGDKDASHRKQVIIVQDGNVAPMALPDLKTLTVEIPDIKSSDCKDGDNGGQMVTVAPKAGDSGRRVIVICTNRIRAQAAMAGAMAMNRARAGMGSALMGLRHARATIEAQSDLAEHAKAEALRGIDQAIAELEKNGAKEN